MANKPDTNFQTRINEFAAMTPLELAALSPSELQVWMSLIGMLGRSDANMPTAFGKLANENDSRRSATLAKKTVDQVFNSAVAATVTGLTFPVLADHYYHFKYVCLVQSDTQSVGVAMTVAVPAVTRFGAKASVFVDVDGPAAIFEGAISASGDVVVPTAVPAINTDYVSVIEGILIPSATGLLQLQARTEVGSTNVIVRQGSCGLLWDLT